MVKKLQSKKGAVSVLMVVFILVLCYMFGSMLDLGNRYWGIRETQSKIDIAGSNALYNSINEDNLKYEVLDIGGSAIGIDGSGAGSLTSAHETVIKNAYKTELANVKFGNASPEILYTKVDFQYTNKGLGYKGTATKSRPQVALESVVRYRVDVSMVTDGVNINKTSTVKSSLSNTSFTVTVKDTAKDGKADLYIHSETKLVLK